MNPVEARIVISAPRADLYAFIADTAGRVSWMDHFLKDYRLTRVNPVGVGAGAAFLVDAPLFPARAEFQIIEADAPRRILERGRIGRIGRTTGWTEWELTDLHGATEITTTVWTDPGIRWDAFKETFGGARPWVRRQMRVSLKRLRTIFEERPERPLARATVAGYEPLKAARYGSA